MFHGFRAVVPLLVTLFVASPVAFPPDPQAAADQLTLRIIVLNSADEAERVSQRLANGDNFVALATQLSLDPSAPTGGMLGRVTVASLRPELQRALEGLHVGQVSKVVRIPTGFALLRIVPDTDAGEGTATVSSPNPALAAIGSVKYAVDLSGMGEALVAMNQFPHPADWNVDPRQLCGMRGKSMAAVQASLVQDLSAGTDADPLQTHYLLAQTYAYSGQMDRAIEELLKAREIAVAKAPSTLPLLEESLGIAYLHRAGFDNGVYRQPGDFCLLSPTGLRALPKTGDSEKAIEHFQRVLAERPDDLELRWLLNLAYMTTGSYPAKVPQPYLIPPSALASPDEVGHFVDIAPRVGLNSFASAGGLIVDDFDNDGRFEVVTSSVDSCDGMHFFHRGADGRFVDQSVQAGVSDQMSSLNIVQTDYNNDGYLDILLLRGGWEFPQRKTLLRNNGDGTFTDVTVSSGLAVPATRTQTAVWTDVNNDGFLDLFVGAENAPAQLFLNRGDGTFIDIAHAAGVDRTAFTKGVTAGDFDNDGWPDLFVSNIGGPDFLYHNNHNGTFTELGKSAGVGTISQGFATWFFDYDNDGWLDLFVTSYFTSIDETVRTYMGLPHNVPTLKLYRNLGDWTFQDVTRQVGLDRVFMPMGSNFGDIDNDGFLDIYLGTGNPSYGSLVPSVLLHNNGGKFFTDVTTSSGTGRPAEGAWRRLRRPRQRRRRRADFRGGGRDARRRPCDAALQESGSRERLDHVEAGRREVEPRRYRSAHQGHSGSGRRRHARHLSHRWQRRIVRRLSLAQHIGLGKAARIADIEIQWPTTDTRQHVANPDKNQWLQITEGSPSAVRLNRPRLSLEPGGKPGVS